MTIKMWGSKLCPDCVHADELFEKNGMEVEERSITDSLLYLKEFLKLRETREEFAPIKENGSIGIPEFLFEDGTLTFDENVALEELKR